MECEGTDILTPRDNPVPSLFLAVHPKLKLRKSMVQLTLSGSPLSLSSAQFAGQLQGMFQRGQAEACGLGTTSLRIQHHYWLPGGGHRPILRIWAGRAFVYPHC